METSGPVAIQGSGVDASRSAEVSIHTTAVLGCVLKRRLAPARVGQRWVAINSAIGDAALVYRIDPAPERRSAREALALIRRAATLRHPHVLPILSAEADDRGILHLVAEYPGTYRGLKHLAELGAQKERGVFDIAETRLAAAHLLGALAHAADAGLAHGGVRIEEALVDPRGRVLVELFGIERALRRDPPPINHAERADLRSIAMIVHEMLTGVPPPSGERERVPIEQSRGRRARCWDLWIARSLADGYRSAAAALAALPQA